MRIVDSVEERLNPQTPVQGRSLDTFLNMASPSTIPQSDGETVKQNRYRAFISRFGQAN